MKEMPLISVVIPLYNVEKYVDYMLRSLIDQTYKKFELILVDDGSTDKTVENVERILGASDCSWKLLRKKNGGAASARNYGINYAKGEWVICPDSDDYFAPQMIERLLSEATKADSKCAFTNYETAELTNFKNKFFTEKNVKTYSAEKMQHLFLERKLQLISPGLLLHKSIAEKIKYNEECPYDEDVFYVWEVLFNVDKVTFIDSNYYQYITRPGSTVHSLKPADYLKASAEYEKLELGLLKKSSNSYIVKRIHPKYKLGGLHVLAKNNDYGIFADTVKKDHYRAGMKSLIFYPNVKLSVYAILYCCSLKLFYLVSRR
jgi:glycosyltransferase involved in cell wall biosynthesis